MKLTTIDGKEVNISKKEIVWTALYLLNHGGYDGRNYILLGNFGSDFYRVSVTTFAKVIVDIRPDFAK